MALENQQTAGQAVTTEDNPSAEDSSASVPVQNLGSYIMGVFNQNARERRINGIDDELTECLRNVKGEYSATEKNNIGLIGQTPLFVNNFRRKKEDFKTIVGAVFLNGSDKPWMLRPTPVEETSMTDAQKLRDQVMQAYIEDKASELMGQGVPQEYAVEMVKQFPPDPKIVAEFSSRLRDETDHKRTAEATRKVERMSKKIADQLGEGRWRETMTSLVDYIATYGTAVLKGPVRRSRQRLHFNGDSPVMRETEVLECEVISPFDCYPSKGAVEITDGDFCQRVRYTPKQLKDMSGLGAGYFKSEIDNLLALYPTGGLMMFEPTDAERRRLENDGAANVTRSTVIEGVEFWGDVRGSLLIGQGVTEKTDGTAIVEDEFYSVNAIVAANSTVLFCVIEDPRFCRNLYKGVAYRIQGSWWGDSICRLMRDPARAYNFKYRATALNAVESSGFMAFYDVNSMVDGAALKLRPYGTYGYYNKTGSVTSPPVKLVQASDNSDRLIMSMQFDEKLFDTCTRIPSSNHVTDASATAGRTYNGLLLIITASKEGANDVVHSLYLDVMRPFLTYMYRYNMLYDEDPDIKGDCEVDAGGLLSILVKEQALSRMEKFLDLARDPNVMRVIGDSGLAALLREYATLLQGINPDNVVPSEAEMERRKKAAEIEARMEKAAQAEQQAVAMMQAQQGGKAVQAEVTPPPYATERGLRQPLEV